MERLTKDNVFEMDMTELALNQVFVRDGCAWYRKGPEDECSVCDLIRNVAANGMRQDDIGLDPSLTDENLGDIMLDWLQFGEKEPEGALAILYRALWAMAELRERLKKYEDTGLEPEEIKEWIEAGKELFFDHADLYAEFGTIDHIRELAQAEKDGRLVVLPCKDDIVYTIEEDYFNCGECRHGDSAHYQAKINRISCDMNNGVHCPFYVKEHKADGFYVKFDSSGSVVLSNPGEFGYEGLEQFCGIDGNVYYTREEAEAALKKREEADNEPD